MATLDELAKQGVVVRYSPALRSRYEFADREIWFLAEAADWLKRNLPSMQARIEGDIPPSHQVAQLLKKFIIGHEFVEQVMFWKMRPRSKDVFELKTSDIRLFGWFVRPKVFVVACCDNFQNTHVAKGIHDFYRDEVIKIRDALPLNEPKFIEGAEPEDVF